MRVLSRSRGRGIGPMLRPLLAHDWPASQKHGRTLPRDRTRTPHSSRIETQNEEFAGVSGLHGRLFHDPKNASEFLKEGLG